jgi:hypothetical protein
LIEALTLTERLGHHWLQHEPLAALAAAMATLNPVKACELLSAVKAENHRDKRTNRAIVAVAILEAETRLQRTVERQQFEEARQRGERLSFKNAVALGLEVARTADTPQ